MSESVNVLEAINSSDVSARSPSTTRRNRIPGKGRRRRAVAEQRRTEHETWRHLVQNLDDDIYVVPPPPPISRRQLRRATRRLANVHAGDADANDDDLLQNALDNFLALLETPHGDSPSTGDVSTPHRDSQLTHIFDTMHGEYPFVNGADTSQEDSPSINVVNIPREENPSTTVVNTPNLLPLDMSYESLGLLEDVKCTASATLVKFLCGHIFDKDSAIRSAFSVEDERCTICQMEFMAWDSCMLLPCLHLLHDGCGSEWFSHYSKLCPVCKRDITEQA